MDGTRDERRDLEGSTDTDVISNLPCEIIDYILKYLPFRVAVRTSILSREWRFKWLNVPNLVFDRNLGDDVEAIISRVLYNHKGHIDKFIIDNFGGFGSHPTMTTDWIRYLSYCQIREFSLKFYGAVPERFLIPSELFTFKNLTHLTLENCEFEPSSCEFTGFDLLVHLDLCRVTVVPLEFCSFISKCPLLEYLSLGLCTGFGALDIDAPRLKTFHVYGNLSSLSLKHTSLIEELFLGLDCLNTSDQLMMNSLGQLSSLTRLTLSGDAVQLLIADGVPEKLPRNHNHLKEVCLRNIFFNHTLEVKFVVCLLRYSPNLESLRIMSSTYEDEDSLQFLTPQERRDISLNHLKEVYINGFKGLVSEMEFVKLILASAAELEKLEIWFDWSMNTELQILKEFERVLPPSSRIKRLNNPQGLAILRKRVNTTLEPNL